MKALVNVAPGSIYAPLNGQTFDIVGQNRTQITLAIPNEDGKMINTDFYGNEVIPQIPNLAYHVEWRTWYRVLTADFDRLTFEVLVCSDPLLAVSSIFHNERQTHVVGRSELLCTLFAKEQQPYAWYKTPIVTIQHLFTR